MRDHRFLLIAATILSGAFGVASARSDDPSIVRNASFIAAHPDLFWRERGIFEYTSGHFDAARTDFRRAAGFADKPSQALLAQMLWNGEGGAVDRVAAYVWADLAAERAYPAFIATRERMWKELSAEEKGAVQAVGEPVFAQFADAVAKPRLERELRRQRLSVTGSRTGRVGTLSVMAVNPNGTMGPPIDGSLYYAPRYWKPEDYWRWQDQPFKQPPRGHVDVGPVSTIPDQPD